MFGVNASASPSASSEQAARLRASRLYQNAERQFLAYLAVSSSGSSSSSTQSAASTQADPALQASAFTLAGTLAESAGDAPRALRWYRAACAVGRGIAAPVDADDVESVGSVEKTNGADDVLPRRPKWDWERRCLEAIGRLLLAEGAPRTASSVREARDTLRTAALALDSGAASLLLAVELASAADSPAQQGPDEPDVEALLHRAAVAAVPGAFESLALLEAAEEGAAKTGSKEASFHRLLSEEWQRVAEASVEGNVAEL